MNYYARYFNIFKNVVYFCDGKAEFSEALNIHSNMNVVEKFIYFSNLTQIVKLVY